MERHTTPTAHLYVWWIISVTSSSISPVNSARRVITGNGGIIPNQTQSLYHVSWCISGNSSLNITVENEVIISYSSESGTSKTSQPAVGQPMSAKASSDEDSEDPGRQLGEFRSHHGDNDSPAEGLCTVQMEAPPGKVLSMLFLNQTCSLHNEVLVDDVLDGSSVTLNGCNVWKSPGYDVTSAGRTALMLIRLRDVSKFYKLEAQVVGFTPAKEKLSLWARYVSPTLGYVQTPSWHGYAKPVYGMLRDTTAIVVPAGHVTMISVVHMYANYYAHKWPRHFCLYLRKRVGRDAVPELVWREKDDRSPPDVELLSDVIEFTVKVSVNAGIFFSGVRVLFSFHQPSLTPERNAEGPWNCSVPDWPDFQQHFWCNNKTECAGGEDEMWCTNLTCPQGGIRLDRTCLFFHLLPRQWARDTWSKAKMACRRRGATLAAFPTMRSWYYLALLLLTDIGKSSIIYTGLQSADISFPHMYRYALRWDEGPLAHFSYHFLWKTPPSCARIEYRQFVFLWYCDETPLNPGVTYALCQATSSPDVATPPRGSEVDTASSQAAPISKPRTPRPKLLVSNGTTLPMTSCLDQHWTHQFLACDALSACWTSTDVTSGKEDFPETDTSGEKSACAGVRAHASGAFFACANSARMVPYSMVCDHLQDCMDNSDEGFCVFPPCSAFRHYTCANGQCVSIDNRCDDVVHCLDETDEENCMMDGLTVCRDNFLPLPPLIANFDGRGFVRYTPLAASAGSVNRADPTLCPLTHFLCPGDGYCLPVYVRCNGVYDCPGLEDELGCESYTCPGFYRCRGLMPTCLHVIHLCDGWPQCPQHDDERFCDTACPDVCTCLGYAFTCLEDFQAKRFSRLRYLDASGSGLKPARLYNNLMLIHLSLSRCKIAHLGNMSLPNLRSLDLSDNRLSVVTIADLNRMGNLQNLSLARNPISGLFPGNSSVFPALLHLDLSEVPINELDIQTHVPFPILRSLNLTKSGVSRLIGEGFRFMTSLATLDLRGCPVTVFPRDLFGGLSKLQQVLADNDKLCCPAMLPGGFNVDNCQAPFNEVSSCDALLRSDIYRTCLALLASLALTGNLGCFCLRALALTGRGKTGFNVFVTHLCLSDFMMGVYLLTIGVADRLYLGKYLWEEVRWRRSAACQVAGTLALLSNEVSAFIICLITLDRFLVIRFPFSQLRFSPFSAQVASLLTWTGGAALVTVPLLPVASSWQFYGQTGICIPLPITRNNSAGHDYSFGVMILLNLVVFLLIAVGQIPVYLSMTRNAMTSNDSTRKSRDLIVARRLVTVVVSDFLCWFPLGVLGMLAANGVPISSEVNVAMAIFVLPLNSALNPFLYTLNIILEKRRRATDAKLLGMIMDGRINEEEHFRKE